MAIVPASAMGAVNAKITPVDGNAIEGPVQYDGKQFTVPDHDPLPKDHVQVVEFGNSEKAAEAMGKPDESQGLTPLAMAQLPKAAEMAKKFPGVSGVILLDDGEFFYHPDGTNSYRYHFAALVLKEEKKAWAQVSVSFEEGRSRAKILYARSIGPDGTVRSLPPDAVKIGSPSEELVFFNPTHKSLSGVIPGVDVGSVIEYSYEFDYYNPEDPRLFSPGFTFQGTEPIVLSRVNIQVPEKVQFNYVTRHFADPERAKPAVEEKDGIKTLTWQVENVPPITPEPMMPPEEDVAPMMEGSIFKDFNEVYALLGKLQQARIKRAPDIDAKVNEIIQGADSLEEKLARLYYWVQDNTRYISIKGSLGAGFSGHTAEETFNNRYGDCTDKSILFVTMLESAGIEAWPIILMTNDAGTGITEIPTLSGNHCITEVRLAKDNDFYLDTTAQDFRYPAFRADDHGAFGMNAIRGEYKQIPVPPPSENRRVSHLDITLDANGDATVKTRNEYNGNIEASIRGFWKQAREDDRKMMMSQYVNTISPGAVLKDFSLTDLADLSKPLVMTMNYALPRHAVRAKKLMYMRMPTLERDFPEVALESRTYPIQYMTTEERVLEINLALPKGYRVKWIPDPIKIANPYISYAAEYKEENGNVVFTETFQRLQRIVPAKDYGDYREALRQIAEFSKKEIFVTEKG